ncbi:hypothetical protein F4861DRAFT_521554 [Xylaria intraflava]|nr:hypothetical protein F4861DRAFT_521554 [Xylaria intraflava]
MGFSHVRLFRVLGMFLMKGTFSCICLCVKPMLPTDRSRVVMGRLPGHHFLFSGLSRVFFVRFCSLCGGRGTGKGTRSSAFIGSLSWINATNMACSAIGAFNVAFVARRSDYTRQSDS